MKKKKKKLPKRRNPSVLPMTLSRKSTRFRHRTEERGGTKNKQAEYQKDIDSAE